MGENGAGEWSAADGQFPPSCVLCSFCGTTRFARSLSQRASDLDAELQFGTSRYLASLVVGRQSAGGGARMRGVGRGHWELCAPRSGRVTLSCFHLHMDLSRGLTDDS